MGNLPEIISILSYLILSSYLIYKNRALASRTHMLALIITHILDILTY